MINMLFVVGLFFSFVMTPPLLCVVNQPESPVVLPQDNPAITMKRVDMAHTSIFMTHPAPILDWLSAHEEPIYKRFGKNGEKIVTMARECLAKALQNPLADLLRRVRDFYEACLLNIARENNSIPLAHATDFLLDKRVFVNFTRLCKLINAILTDNVILRLNSTRVVSLSLIDWKKRPRNQTMQYLYDELVYASEMQLNFSRDLAGSAKGYRGRLLGNLLTKEWLILLAPLQTFTEDETALVVDFFSEKNVKVLSQVEKAFFTLQKCACEFCR